MPEDPIAFLISSRTERPAARAHLWPLIIIALILLAVAVSFFGTPEAKVVASGSPSASEAPGREARTYTVSYRFGVFSPTNLRIHTGDTVRFRNDSSLPIHVVAALEEGQKVPEFDSVGQVQPGSYFSYTFSTAGTFGYYNDDDGSQSGVIIVR